MARWYLDCEFNGYGGELLSLALKREGGGGLYWINARPPGNLDLWVAANVMPVLRSCEAQPVETPLDDLPEVIEDVFKGWSERNPIIVADWPDDVRFFCESVMTGPGTMIEINSLRFEVRRVDAYPTALPGAVQHNAWWDACALELKVQGA